MKSPAATPIHFAAGLDAPTLALAARLSAAGTPYRACPAPLPEGGWQLHLDANGLALAKAGEKQPFRLDAAPLLRRTKARDSGIARAVGAGPGVKLFDATAGWGTDGLTLARLGCSATLVECAPLAFALLEDLARRSGIDAHIQFGDARMCMAEGFDVIYLDPMFEPRSNPALPGKALQVLREVAGEPPATPLELLALARHHAQERVVLKRRARSRPLATPHWQIRGRTVRFDVYRPA